MLYSTSYKFWYQPSAQSSLKLRRRLPRALQHHLRLGRLHHIALNLQLPTHEQLLRLRLPLHQLPKILITETQHHIALGRALGLISLANSASFLDIDPPALGLAGLVLERERKDAVALLDGVLFSGFVVERGRDQVEGGGGGEGGWESATGSVSDGAGGRGEGHTVCERHYEVVVVGIVVRGGDLWGELEKSGGGGGFKRAVTTELRGGRTCETGCRGPHG